MRDIPAAMLSAVVPTLNEARVLPRLLAGLRREADEIVIADGGSTDGTLGLAEGAVIAQSQPGRGPQLNAGAAAATGDVLWFVHADSEIPPGAGDAIRHAARQSEWGCFSARIVSEDPRLRFCGRWMTLRARRGGSCSGDMGMWMRRAFFEQLGGFQPWPALEDLDLADRARARAPIAVLPLRLGSSARRWESEGVGRTILRMWAVRGGYRLGLDPLSLVRWYRSHPRGS